jgi:mycothiol synthase
MAIAIARRLVSQTNPDIDQAARRLVAAAPEQGIDMRLTWASVDDAPGGTLRVRQACLAVPGSGRTVMLFLSEPPRTGEIDKNPEAGLNERTAVLTQASSWIARERRGSIVLAQSLPSPEETWAIIACLSAGFVKVGTLHYLRKPAAPSTTAVSPPASWPDGLRVVSVSSLPPAQQETQLLRAMEGTYVDTLDCPELCGLRATRDILASHKATGRFDPALWWLALAGDEPVACALMSLWPEQRSCELVYLGIVPAWRGKGLGRKLFEHATNAATTTPSGQRQAGLSFTCAVDERNTPALRLYDSLGYRAFAKRVALVKTLSLPELPSTRDSSI